MTKETLKSAKEVLENANLDSLFTEAIGEAPEENDNQKGLMFNVETNELFFLSYATPENSWARTSEQQNPWILLGYVTGNDIVMGNPAKDIADRIDYEFEQQEQMDRERETY
jgi:hypothetical protein